jgi:hypothetical protein
MCLWWSVVDILGEDMQLPVECQGEQGKPDGFCAWSAVLQRVIDSEICSCGEGIFFSGGAGRSALMGALTS